MTASKQVNHTIVAVKGLPLSFSVFDKNAGKIIDCAITPELPLGVAMTVDHHACVLQGTPLQLSARTLYTVIAHHAKGENTALIEMSVVEAPIKAQRGEILRVHDSRGDLDTPRSQIENAMGDEAMMSSIKPHEKFKTQPQGDDKRLSQQTANNPEAEHRAQQSPELTPSPSAQLQAQAVHAATPTITPKPTR